VDYGGIIRRAWHVTWRNRGLWILGVFAGVSGCTGGAGGGSGGGSGGNSGSGSGTGSGFGDWALPGGTGGLERFAERAQELLPLIVAVVVLLAFVGLLWSVFAVAARGGLVVGVNAAEEGAPRTTAELWREGFGRFWSLVGLDILLKLPLVAVSLLMLVMIVVPVAGTLAGGGEPGVELIAPVCGSLAFGIPVLVIGGFVLGIMHLLALRYVMLGGQGAVEAVRNGWLFLRARIKDSVIIWFLTAALNMGASFVVAIPAVVIGIGLAVPLAAAIAGGEWAMMLAALPVALLLFTVLGLVYNAVWGTYTSALWTLFFRDSLGLGGTADGGEAPGSAVGDV
jgi:hypothetical protein